jgi:DNA-binding NarL/FixJ family response regulator
VDSAFKCPATLTADDFPRKGVAVLIIFILLFQPLFLTTLINNILCGLKILMAYNRLVIHAYLSAYVNMSQSQQTDILRQVKTLGSLTVREQEVLQLILSGKSNLEIAGALFISENTVKTHARSVFSKYDVSSRAELISTLLKNQTVR